MTKEFVLEDWGKRPRVTKGSKAARKAAQYNYDRKAPPVTLAPEPWKTESEDGAQKSENVRSMNLGKNRQKRFA